MILETLISIIGSSTIPRNLHALAIHELKIKKKRYLSICFYITVAQILQSGGIKTKIVISNLSDSLWWLMT